MSTTPNPRGYRISGYAWSANVGWLNFEVGSVVGEQYQPYINPSTGELTGWVWGANVGWIALKNVGISFVNSGITNDVKSWCMYE